MGSRDCLGRDKQVCGPGQPTGDLTKEEESAPQMRKPGRWLGPLNSSDTMEKRVLGPPCPRLLSFCPHQPQGTKGALVFWDLGTFLSSPSLPSSLPSSLAEFLSSKTLSLPSHSWTQ